MGDVENHGAVVYVTNFMPRVRSALAFVPSEGPPVLLANISTRDIPAARLITSVEDIRAFSKMAKDVGDLLTERKLEAAKIGLCGVHRTMPWTEWRALETALPKIAFADRSGDLSSLRASKEACEVDAVRRAADLADIALDRATSELRPGVTMQGAIARLDAAVRSQGAEDVRFLVASGEQTGVGLRPVDDRILAAGDPIMLYVAVQNQRYWGEAARTYVLGAPSVDQQRLHDIAAAALAELRDVCRAGEVASAVSTAGRRALGDLADCALGYGLGSGIGLDSREAPLFTPSDRTLLPQNATISLHVILNRGGHGAAVGGTFWLGEQGLVSLTQQGQLMNVCK
jgi:Xaa-Pro aminopeptidase